MLFPLLVQRFSVFAVYFHWREELLHLETCAEDDDVEVFSPAAGAGDAGLVDLLDAFCDELAVWFVESVEVVGIEDAALAPCEKILA